MAKLPKKPVVLPIPKDWDGNTAEIGDFISDTERRQYAKWLKENPPVEEKLATERAKVRDLKEGSYEYRVPGISIGSSEFQYVWNTIPKELKSKLSFTEDELSYLTRDNVAHTKRHRAALERLQKEVNDAGYEFVEEGGSKPHVWDDGTPSTSRYSWRKFLTSPKAHAAAGLGVLGAAGMVSSEDAEAAPFPRRGPQDLWPNARFEDPDSTDLMAFSGEGGKGKSPLSAALRKGAENTFWNNFNEQGQDAGAAGVVDMLGTLATGIGGQVAGGLAGLFEGASEWAGGGSKDDIIRRSNETLEDVSRSLTYMPDEGSAAMQGFGALGQAGEWAGKNKDELLPPWAAHPFDTLGEYSPALGAGALALSNVIDPSMFGKGGLVRGAVKNDIFVPPVGQNDWDAARAAMGRINAGEDPALVWKETGWGMMPSDQAGDMDLDMDPMQRMVRETDDSKINWRPGVTIDEPDSIEIGGRKFTTVNLGPQGDIDYLDNYLTGIEDIRDYVANQQGALPVVSSQKDRFADKLDNAWYSAPGRLGSIGEIGMGPMSNEDSGLDTMIHELQHAVQDRWEQPIGGSRSQFGYDMYQQENILAKERIDSLWNNNANVLHESQLRYLMSQSGLSSKDEAMFKAVILKQDRNTPPSMLARLDNLLDKYKTSSDAMVKAHKSYENIQGEAMARLAADRRTMSAQERAESYPFSPEEFKRQTGSNIDDLILNPDREYGAGYSEAIKWSDKREIPLVEEMLAYPLYQTLYKGRTLDMVDMTPEEFLRRANRGNTDTNWIDQWKLDRVREAERGGIELPRPTLWQEIPGSDVATGHEGRHRSLVAGETGNETMPVDILRVIAGFEGPERKLGWQTWNKLQNREISREEAEAVARALRSE